MQINPRTESLAIPAFPGLEAEAELESTQPGGQVESN